MAEVRRDRYRLGTLPQSQLTPTPYNLLQMSDHTFVNTSSSNRTQQVAKEKQSLSQQDGSMAPKHDHLKSHRVQNTYRQ